MRPARDEESDGLSMLGKNSGSSFSHLGVRDVLLVVSVVTCCCLSIALVNEKSSPPPPPSVLPPPDVPSAFPSDKQIVAKATSEGCSGHGMKNSDTNKCECSTCYVGAACESRIPDCKINAAIANTVFVESFWEHTDFSATIHPSYRSGFMSQHRTGWHESQLLMLEDAIKELHLLTGNVDPKVLDTHQLVFGTGVGTLVRAANFALTRARNVEQITHQEPYYYLFANWTTHGSGRSASWVAWDDLDADKETLEWVTIPNSPDGKILRPLLEESAAVGTDLAWWWPIYTPVTPLDHDLMVFSFGKATGLTGIRFSWALVKDPVVAKLMRYYMLVEATAGVSIEVQINSLQIVRSILADGGEFFRWGQRVLAERWEKIEGLVARAAAELGSARVEIAREPAELCHFTQQERQPTMAFMWIRCKEAADKGRCAEAFQEEVGLGVKHGSMYYASDSKVRMSVSMREEEFQIVAEKFAQFLRLPH